MSETPAASSSAESSSSTTPSAPQRPLTQICISNYGPVGKTKIHKVITQLKSLPGITGYNNYFKPRAGNELFLVFNTKEDEQNAIKVYKEFNTSWEISVRPMPPKKIRTRETPVEEEGPEKKKQRLAQKSITEVVTPLAAMPYAEQLKHKEDSMKVLFKTFYNQLAKTWMYENPKSIQNPTPKYLAEFVEKKKQGDQTLPVEWLGIVESPQLNDYRNKCEFTCGYDLEDQPCVGFLYGNFRDGLVAVARPDNCLNIPKQAKALASLYTTFIKKHADTYKPYTKTTHTGFWRLLMVRQNLANDVMVMFQVNPKGVETEKMEAMQKELLAFFVEETKSGSVLFNSEQVPINLASVYFQTYDGVSNAAPPESPTTLIHGNPYIYETVLGVKFQISVTSFFQVNIKATEKLYSIARDWALGNQTEHKDSVLLDICCGTGTIGLIMANKFQKVHGIEMVQSAIEDAKKNADLNSITNANFICAKAEDALKSLIYQEKLDTKDTVAIVDPPRSGLHKKVSMAMLNCKAIKRLVYVSCNAKTMVENLMQLCGPPTNTYPKPKFRPVRAVCVDLFPHTDHCEMVVLLERLPEDETPAPTSTASSNNAATTTVSSEPQSVTTLSEKI